MLTNATKWAYDTIDDMLTYTYYSTHEAAIQYAQYMQALASNLGLDHKWCVVIDEHRNWVTRREWFAANDALEQAWQYLLASCET